MKLPLVFLLKKIRETKKIVKKIVDESASSPEAKSIIVGIDDLDQLDLSNKPLAVAIGYKESVLSSVGYGMLSDNQIFEDILYDNKNFNPTEMCMSRFKSIPTTRLLPVYKYFSKSEITPSEGSHLRKYIENHNSIDKIYSRNISKTLKKVPELSEIKDILEEIYERQRRKMHDYKNQLSTIQTLIKNGHTDEALSFTQWSSCKEMVFVCVIWSFDDMGLGEQVILSDKGNRETEQIINIGKVIIFWNRDGRMFYVKDYR